jgi:MFS family permease
MPGYAKDLAGRLFPALRSRDFRLFWIGQCVSLVGTWMQNVGQAWLVLELTGSSTKLGLVSAAQFLPTMLLSLFAGPVADRLPKRRVLIVTQCSLMLLAAALATVTALGVARFWMVLLLALLLGFVNLVDIPTRQSYVVELCGRESLMNAVSLNSAAFNLARMLGPAAAGLLIEAIGIAPCFYLNALSFAGTIAALLAVRARPRTAPVPLKGLRDLVSSAQEGMRYVIGKREILLPLSLLAAVSTFVINYNILVPTFARGPLGRGASGYGFLMTCLGAGSLAAALSLAATSRGGPRTARIYGGAAGLCAALAACGLQRSYALSCILLAVIGFCTISMTASTNASVQLASEDGYRGRVMSVYALVFGGVTPVGALYSGAVTEAAGPAACMVLSGGLGLAATAAALALRRSRSARPPARDRSPDA